MYIKTKLKPRITITNPPETVASIVTQGMKKKPFDDEVKAAASSTLSKDQSISICKFIEKIAFMCSIYNLNFLSLVREDCLE